MRYAGGKNAQGVYHKIINIIPRCDVFCELFAGSAAITRLIALPRFTILNELSIPQYNKLTPLMYEKTNTKMAFLNTDAIDLLHNVEPLINMLSDCGIKIHLYLDPPYPFDARRSKRKIYSNELSDQQHEDLLYTLVTLRCNIQISSYKNELYDRYLLFSNGWNTLEFKAMTHAGISNEIVYYNYDASKIELQDYSYIGDNFRQRELRKKRQNNLEKKIMELDSADLTFLTERLRNIGITI